MTTEDASLVTAVRRGDRAAFAELIGRHRQRAVALAYSVLGDMQAAEDVAQEATYQAYFEIDQLRVPTSFGAWLGGIALNLAKMALRGRKRTVSWHDVTADLHLPGVPLANDPAFIVETLDLQERLLRALETLSVDMRAAVWLHYMEAMTYQEISAVTGIPASRLRVLSHRARRRLREDLAAEWRPRIEKKGTAMIEVTVQDVMLREQPGDAETRTVQPHFSGWVVFLKSRSDDRAIGIWLGAAEGEAVAMHLGNITAPRPPTYTFMANLLNGLGAAVKTVAITDLTNETFMASVTLQSKDRTIEIDARPSDAVNLALRSGAPILVAEAIFERVGFETQENTVEQWRAKAQASSGQGEPDNSKWLSGIEVARERYHRGQEQLERLRAAVEEQRRTSDRSGEAPG